MDNLTESCKIWHIPSTYFWFKPPQLNFFPIKHRIRKIIDPIAHDSGQSMVASFVLHGLVLVAEDEEIDGWVEVGLLLGILVEARFWDVIVIAAFHFVFEFLQAVVMRPSQCQADTQVRM